MKHDKKVKPHKMYCKDGSVHDVKTYKEHKALMKKGCGHKKPKNQKNERRKIQTTYDVLW